MFDYRLYDLAKDDYERMVLEGERAWQRRQWVWKTASLPEHALAWVGTVLVNTGQRLQRSHAAETGPA